MAQNWYVVDTLKHSNTSKDSVFYSAIKSKLSKSKVGREVYGAVFRDVYNSTPQKKEIENLELNQFVSFEGKTIAKIYVKQLEVFGPTVNDTLRKGSKIEHFISKNFHTNTQENLIRKSLLLFKEGELLKARVLRENERLLRTNPIIHDARILVFKHKNLDDMVDVLVLIQDVWAKNINVNGSSFKNFSLGLENKNFRGKGHSLYHQLSWKATDSLQKVGWRTIYTIPYIKNTWTTAQFRFIYEKDIKQIAAKIYRPFLSIDTKNAGSIELGYLNTREYKRLIINNKDRLLVYPVAQYYSDFWYGRAFKLNQNEVSKRLVLAIRRTNFEFNQRPKVTENENKIYWNRTTWLVSTGYSDRNYRRDFLVYGFGRTEDIPIGKIVSLTGGLEQTEFGKRTYLGSQISFGTYLSANRGYFYSLFNAGSFFKDNAAQQGVLSLKSFYFSPLYRLGGTHFRQFISLNFTYGIKRDALDYLNISGREGILGVNSDALRGDKQAVLGLESVLFSRKSIFGFRVAHFVYVNLGMVALNQNALVSSPIYQGYGLGIRLRNENLTFNTFQIRVGYYPNIPLISNDFRFAFEGVQPLRLRDFDISAPQVIPLK